MNVAKLHGSQSDPIATQPSQIARQLGYRMAAEWEPIDRVWLTEPHNAETWPGCLDEAQQQFAHLIDQMRPYAQPCTTQNAGITTNDSWIRDYGPLFVVNEAGGVACHDFVFNCWGDKYGPYGDDNAVAGQIAGQLGLPVWHHSEVLEGGSIEVNGQGTVMTTRQCLINPNRNPDLNQQQIEQMLHDALGTKHVIWLPGGIEGDDTDGHIDDVARFINADTVAAVRSGGPDAAHPDSEVLERNWQALQDARDQSGGKLNLVELPAPAPIFYDYPADEFGPGGRKPLPASYANFLITNGAVFVPIFGQHPDDTALRTLERAMPGYSVIGIRAERLVIGLGAFHCLSMGQPAISHPSPLPKPTTSDK